MNKLDWTIFTKLGDMCKGNLKKVACYISKLKKKMFHVPWSGNAEWSIKRRNCATPLPEVVGSMLGSAMLADLSSK